MDIHRERGQASFEAALAVPLFFMIIFAFMQVCWTSFATSDLESGISHMEQSIDDMPESAMASPEAAAAWAADSICERATVLDRSRLTVTNVSVSADNRSSSAHDVPRGSGTREFTDTRGIAGRTHLVCDVAYDNTLMFAVPGAQSLTHISRHVDATENGYQEFEVR